MGRHLLSVDQFPDAQSVIDFFSEVDTVFDGPRQSDRILASLFLEPSTRTRLSFEAAMLRLGGQVISVADGSTCSRAKGESVEDTVLTVGQYADIIAMRHPESGSVIRAAAGSRVPVVNGGDGDGEHPTQALLDLYTVWKEFGAINGCQFILKGDLKYSRTVHSIARLLRHFDVSVLADAGHRELEWWGDSKTCKITPFSEGILHPKNVVLYMTRPQKERWPNLTVGIDEYVSLAEGSYWALKGDLSWLPKKSIILHALPRTKELPDNVPNLGIWKQVRHGVPVRAAVMKMAIEGHAPWRSFGNIAA